MTVKQRYFGILVAAGQGTRMGAEIPKQYLSLLNKTIFEHSLTALLQCELLEKIVVVVAENDFYWPKTSLSLHPKIITAIGAQERSGSVLNGLSALQLIANAEDWILVHDSARPCLKQEDLQKLIQELSDHPVGGLLATPVTNTIKKLDKLTQAVTTINRHELWQALTPQMFRYQMLINAINHAHQNNVAVTDDASAMELCGHNPKLVEGCSDNIKITSSLDLLVAEQILTARFISDK